MPTDPGALLREARLRQGLTQKALAEKAGTTQSAISRIEMGGQSATIAHLDYLLHLLGEELILGARPKPGTGKGSNLLYLPR